MEPASLSPVLPSSPAKKSSQELPVYPIDVHVRDASPTTANHDSAGTIAATPGLHDQVRLSVIADEMDVDNGTASAPAPLAPTLAAGRSQMKTPELQTMQQVYTPGSSQQAPGSGAAQGTGVERSPSTPGHIPLFDWDEFEARYEQALGDMNGQEKELLEEFDRLYFNVWAAAAAAHDDERAVKRLQTRERYVKIAEQTLGQRKQHLTEVVQAFQSALALLSQP